MKIIVRERRQHIAARPQVIAQGDTMIPTPEQQMIREAMRQFAQERLAPNAAQWDREHRFPKEALAELGGLGAMGPRDRLRAEW